MTNIGQGVTFFPEKRSFFLEGSDIEFVSLNVTDPWKEVDGERASIKTRHPLFSDPAVRQAIKPETAVTLTDIMEKVVTDGTAKAATDAQATLAQKQSEREALKRRVEQKRADLQKAQIERREFVTFFRRAAHWGTDVGGLARECRVCRRLPRLDVADDESAVGELAVEVQPVVLAVDLQRSFDADAKRNYSP